MQPEIRSRPRVVVVGGGFGGLHAARKLANVDCDVLIVDRKNHHLFQPLLYQVATAALSPSDIATPIRGIFTRQRNVEVTLADARDVRLDERTVRLGDGVVEWDRLVLAAGVTHTWFGNAGWAPHAPGLKTLDDALELRRRILIAFEKAEFEDDPTLRASLLTFVVVGAGPTGVEMVGALREIAARTIPRDFRRVDTRAAQVILVEGADRVLPGMSPTSSTNALEALQGMSIEVELNTRVTDVDGSGINTSQGRIEAGTVIWAAGVKAVPIASQLYDGDHSPERDGQGRIITEPDCSIPGHPDVFVVGDLAAREDPQTGGMVPGVAQGAIQMGAFVGGILADEIRNGIDPGSTPRPAFRYKDKGSLATIGVRRAVADLGGRSFSGFFAWLLWSLIHIAFLIGFRNRIMVLVNWLWQWLLQARGARLITGIPDPHPKAVPPDQESSAL